MSESQVIENEATSSDHPSFSARYRYRHQASKIVLDEAHVLFSHLGLRVEQRIDDSASAFIANFAEDKFWFIDRKRQLVHTVPVIATQNGSVDDFLSSMHYSAGFIELSPCLDLDRTSGSTETWQGLTVQRWTCLYEGKPVEEQWFASSPGVVVRAQSSDGFLRELTDIRNRETYPENFQPPLHYRSVSIDELLSPSAVIGKYVE